jgi:CDGSH iron-sulfur domain-containing protein 3
MDSKIKISDNGPLEVSGDFQLLDSEGNEYQKKAKVYLCRCGLSIKNPFVMDPIKEVDLKAIQEYQDNN